jgi:hypothetical protein
MPPKFQNCNRKTKKTNLQSFSDYRLGGQKNRTGKTTAVFLPCFLLVYGRQNLSGSMYQGHLILRLIKHVRSDIMSAFVYQGG